MDNNTCDNCSGMGRFCDLDATRGHGCTRCFHLQLPCRQHNGAPLLPRPLSALTVCEHCFTICNPSCDISTRNNKSCTTCAYEGRPCMANTRRMDPRPVPPLPICDPCQVNHLGSCSWVRQKEQLGQEPCNNCAARNIVCTHHGQPVAGSEALFNGADHAGGAAVNNNVRDANLLVTAPVRMAAPPAPVADTIHMAAPTTQATEAPEQTMRPCAKEHGKLRPISDFSMYRGRLAKTCDPCREKERQRRMKAEEEEDEYLDILDAARIAGHPAPPRWAAPPSMNLPGANLGFTALPGDNVGFAPQPDANQNIDPALVALDRQAALQPTGQQAAYQAPHVYSASTFPHRPDLQVNDGYNTFGSFGYVPPRPKRPRSVHGFHDDDAPPPAPVRRSGEYYPAGPLGSGNDDLGNVFSNPAEQGLPANPVPPPSQATAAPLPNAQVVPIAIGGGRFRCPHPNCADSRKVFKTSGGVKAHYTTIHLRPLQPPPIPLFPPAPSAANPTQQAPEYDCPYCPQTNFKAHGLKTHIRTKHPGMEVPEFDQVPGRKLCEYCGLYFTARGLGPHKTSHGAIHEELGKLKDKWK